MLISEVVLWKGFKWSMTYQHALNLGLQTYLLANVVCPRFLESTTTSQKGKPQQKGLGKSKTLGFSCLFSTFLVLIRMSET